MPEGSKFCPNCQTKVKIKKETITTVQMKCKSCGGLLDVKEDALVLECPFCNSKEMIVESDSVTIERIKSRTHKDIEFAKLQYEVENKKRKDERAEIKAFKKGIASKFLILFTLICVFFFCMDMFYKDFVTAIIAFIQVCLFILAWLMGMHFIKEPKHLFRLVPTLIGIILFIPLILVPRSASSDYTITYEEYKWPDSEICSVVPAPPSKFGNERVYDNQYFSIDIGEISEEQFKAYVKACIEKGFTVDSKESGEEFYGFNELGYKLKLYYTDFRTQLTISITAPLDFKEYVWPNTALGNMLPVPESNMASISYESSNGFTIYVGNTSIDEYTAYVSSCFDKGFNIDYYRQETFFSADNEDGYPLSVVYEGNNTMLISIYTPSAN